MTGVRTREAEYLAAHEAFEHNGASAGPTWLRERRRAAAAEFRRAGFPVARRGNEAWKYTDVRPIATRALTLPAPHAGTVDASPYDLPCPRVHQLVFVDGHYAPALSTEPPSEAGQKAEVLGRRGDGPVVGRLADAVEYRLPLAEEHLGTLASPQSSAFTALNTAFVHDGAYVAIPAGLAVAEPVYLLFITTGAPAVTHPRVLLHAGRNASATVVVAHESLTPTGGGFTNAVAEVLLDAGASLRMVSVQREARDGQHVEAAHARLESDARLAWASLDLGGGLVRRETSVSLAGPGASVDLAGLYIAGAGQHVDNHTFIDHAVPDTASDELFKGILDGDAHGVFAGQVLVRQDAQRTDARQMNKNLLLAPGAQVDTQPMLEIFADDVRCTHGAAVGQLDQGALFYLKSRGLGDAAARRLLTHGFVTEVLTRITDDAVRQYADAAVLAHLDAATI
ncbi:MAG: Fe-S cluster assembly protein SufD [Chloroflexota bacterium]